MWRIPPRLHLRAYEIISRLPNQTEDEEESWDEQDLEEPGDFNEEEFQDLVDRLQADMDQRSRRTRKATSRMSLPSQWTIAAISSRKWCSY